MYKTFAIACAIVLVLISLSGALAQDNAAEVKKAEDGANESGQLVSITADDSKLTDALKSLAKQTNEKILVESTVKGNVTLTLNSVSLETALGALCKSAKVEWRRLYISPESKLLEQPDKLAATVRLMTGMSFPDLVLAGSSTGSVGMHCAEQKAVKAAEDKVVSELGLQRVYLITNDAAIAQKKMDDASKSAIENYIAASKKLLDDFMKMSPEEQEAAVVEGIMQYEQMDPAYTSRVMQAVMRVDPDLLKRMTARGTEALLHMSEQDRRAMMKLQIELQKTIAPEQMKILQEDAKAVMEEIQKEQGN